MFRIMGSLVAVTTLLLGASQVATAHDNGYRGHTATAFHYGVFYRPQYMPRWLSRDRRFQQWYVRTPLRFNYRLRWNDLHDAYRWDRRYSKRGVYRSNWISRYGIRSRQATRVERKWRDDSRRKNKARKSRRNRDDD